MCASSLKAVASAVAAITFIVAGPMVLSQHRQSAAPGRSVRSVGRSRHGRDTQTPCICIAEHAIGRLDGGRVVPTSGFRNEPAAIGERRRTAFAAIHFGRARTW